MAGIDRFLPGTTGHVVDAQPTPLLTRFAALHGDPDRAAGLLAEAARGIHLDIERLLVAHEEAENSPAGARRGLRLGLVRSRDTQPALGVVPSAAARAT